MNRRSAFICLSAAALISGCDALVSPSRYGTVVVEAVSRDSQPVADLQVLLYTGTRHMGYGVTDANGRAVFHHVPAGGYGVYAEPAGEWLLTREAPDTPAQPHVGVSVLADSTSVVRYVLALRNSGVISVRVVDEAGMAIGGAAVSLYTYQGILDRSTTTGSGDAKFTGLPVAEYGVIVRPPDSARVTPIESYIDGLSIREPGDSLGVTARFTRSSPSLAP